MTTFFNYLLTAMIPIMIVAFVLPELAKFEASLERALEVFSSEPDITPPDEPVDPGPLQGRIEFRNVRMAYLDEHAEPLPNAVLENVSFVIEPGETVAILGQTGSGKTTLINLIPRFYDVCDGQVLVDGHDVRTLELTSLREQIGSPNNGRSRSPARRHQLAVWAPGRRVRRDLRRFAHRRRPRVHLGPGRRLRRPRRRAGQEPLRRPAAAAQPRQGTHLRSTDPHPRRHDVCVDVATEARIQAALADRFADRTVLIVAQRITTAIGADKIILLEAGHVADVGNHAELIERSALYREIVESQLGPLEEIAELMAHR